MYTLQQGLKFKHPFKMNICELENVLDCYSLVPRGNWPQPKPRLVAAFEQYQACFDAASALHLEEEQIIGEYLLGQIEDQQIR